MTIEPRRDDFVVHCDSYSCPEYIEVDSRVFTDAVREVKRRGWTFRKDKDGKWVHKCIICQDRGK